MRHYGSISTVQGVVDRFVDELLDPDEYQTVDVGRWHAQDVAGQPPLVSRELRNVIFEIDVPEDRVTWMEACRPNMPWAEDHFMERIGGQPLNPPPSHIDWPWASYNERHQVHQGERFSHTYPERLWPKAARKKDCEGEGGEEECFVHGPVCRAPLAGVRFKYGDFGDVIDLLVREPYTRQAYVPIWFPEDTGAVHGERVPCTLGYHLMRRPPRNVPGTWPDLLHCVYTIRSCDFVRHFRDDLYLAGRLMQWVVDEVNSEGEQPHDQGDHPLVPGKLTFHCHSFHCFEGDVRRLQKGDV